MNEERRVGIAQQLLAKGTDFLRYAAFLVNDYIWESGRRRGRTGMETPRRRGINAVGGAWRVVTSTSGETQIKS